MKNIKSKQNLIKSYCYLNEKLTIKLETNSLCINAKTFWKLFFINYEEMMIFNKF